MKGTLLILASLLLLAIGSTALSQTVIAPGQKEAERLYRESIRESRFNKLYYDEYDKCRRLLREERFKEAEASCERVIGYSENLPKESYLERHSGYVALGIAQMRHQKFREAIANFECALEIAKPSLGDTDSETADVYFLIGQSHHLNGNVGAARAYYEAAEKTYRAAFKHMGDDKFFLVPYSKKIRDVV